jgi:inorganic pyrophosphatase
MSLCYVDAGRNVPNEVNVVIEIPANGDPVKYEVDKKSGALFVDRFMTTAMHYPCNYGYIPQTLAEDGDPVDVLVVAPFPILSGSVIRCRPVGKLVMTDEAGEDSKILAVPIDKASVLYRNIKSPQDLPESFLQTITHFFQHYKDLEPGKWVKVTGWQDGEAARDEIINSIERYRSTKVPQ